VLRDIYLALPAEARTGEEELEHMDFIGWIIIGAIAGGIASLIVPGRTPGGVIGAIIVGILGGLLGGWLMGLFGMAGPATFIGSLIVSIIGAVIILFVLRAFSSRTTTA
jgi:uncharacterized membrane protein YeaQ/YmgE (transglycosylase-associated protein family)